MNIFNQYYNFSEILSGESSTWDDKADSLISKTRLPIILVMLNIK